MNKTTSTRIVVNQISPVLWHCMQFWIFSYYVLFWNKMCSDCAFCISLCLVAVICCFFIIMFSGLQHYECVVPLAISNLQSGRFWAILTASVSMRLWDSRSFRTVVIYAIRRQPGVLFKSSGRSAVRTFLASALSSNLAMSERDSVTGNACITHNRKHRKQTKHAK